MPNYIGKMYPRRDRKLSLWEKILLSAGFFISDADVPETTTGKAVKKHFNKVQRKYR